MDTLEDKVVVVTGGASGIGLAIARAVAARGAVPVIADIEADAFADALATLPEGTLAVPTDVADLASVEALRDAVLDRHGRVDVIVNNAGVSTFNLLADQTIDDWRWVLGVNLWGVIHGVATFVPVMKAQGTPGHVVNVSSVAGLMSGLPFIGPYAVSKVGVVSISETLRQELGFTGEPIGVSVVCPGSTNTRVAESDRNRPATIAPEARTEAGEGMRVAVADTLTAPTGFEPSVVADEVVDAVLTGRFWVIPSTDMVDGYRARFAEILDNCPPEG